MIQEKDFLYRVPVKTAPITTPGGQIRNPEILVDVEGGEFMHGNILDANSTNKLINQSVKDAVDNKLVEGGCVTKDLLEAETTRATEQENSLKTLIDAETSARTKGDEDLSSKIKAEQTRAEGKEKEISDKLAIVNGDSNTEGSFRKAIADVVAAAPEDLDTLKEIADKLAGNDDLHTALNQAITEKADASALANEVSRATGAESGLQAAIATKADATALSNYVLTTALNQQIDTLNTAISAKQDAGNYIPYNATVKGSYQIDKVLDILTDNGTAKFGPQECIVIQSNDGATLRVQPTYLSIKAGDALIEINPSGISLINDDSFIRLDGRGVILPYGDNSRVLTSNGTTINIGEYATQSDLNAQLAPKANRSDLISLEHKITANTTAIEGKQDKGNYITANVVQDTYFELEKGLKIYNEAANKIMTISHNGIELEANETTISINSSGVFVDSTSDGTLLYSFTPLGIRFAGKTENDIPTANGSFIDIRDYATRDFVTAGLSAKQNKIPVNTIDATDIETADVTKLRTIVTNLIKALISSGLINATDSVE